MTHDGRMFVCVGIFWMMYTNNKGSKSEQCEGTKRKRGTCCCVTCGTKGDECLRVFADHLQFVFGKRQPEYDVLYKVVGDDGGHVPLQLPQHNQLPVLKKTYTQRKNDLKMCQFTLCFSAILLSQGVKMACCHASIDREKRSHSVPIPRGNGSVRRVTFLHFISPRCILLSACLSHSSHPLCSYRRHVTSFALLRGPANETS